MLQKIRAKINEKSSKYPNFGQNMTKMNAVL